MDHHRHIHLSSGDRDHAGPDARDLDHMMGFIVALTYFALVLLAFGTMCALISSWRQGVLERDWEWVKTGLHQVFLRFKKFTHRKNK